VSLGEESAQRPPAAAAAAVDCVQACGAAEEITALCWLAWAPPPGADGARHARQSLFEPGCLPLSLQILVLGLALALLACRRLPALVRGGCLPLCARSPMLAARICLPTTGTGAAAAGSRTPAPTGRAARRPRRPPPPQRSVQRAGAPRARSAAADDGCLLVGTSTGHLQLHAPRGLALLHRQRLHGGPCVALRPRAAGAGLCPQDAADDVTAVFRDAVARVAALEARRSGRPGRVGNVCRLRQAAAA
jgi:hypothetical protein